MNVERLKALFVPRWKKRAGLVATELFPEDGKDIRWVAIDKVWYYGNGEDTTEYKRKRIMAATAHKDDFENGEVKVPMVLGSAKTNKNDNNA